LRLLVPFTLRVANPYRAEDAFDGGGLAIAEISWRK